MKLDDRLKATLSLLEVAAVLGFSSFLSVFAEGAQAGSARSAVVVVGSLILVVIVFVLIIRWFRSRSARLRAIRESLVSSYLSTLDRSSLNPAGLITIPSNHHPANLRRE